jgi:hypothetical protein
VVGVARPHFSLVVTPEAVTDTTGTPDRGEGSAPGPASSRVLYDLRQRRLVTGWSAARGSAVFRVVLAAVRDTWIGELVNRNVDGPIRADR